MRSFMMAVMGVAVAVVLSGCTAGRMSQSEFDEFRANADETVATFRSKNAELIDGAAGYAVFPFVGKGGAGWSLAFGRGVVYAQGEPIGLTGYNNGNFGFTLGGQAYEQILVLHSPEDVEKFTGGPWTGSAQANAVFGPWGVSADADFRSGQTLVTEDKFGLMYDASIGVSKYTYRSLEDAIRANEPEGDVDG